MRNMGKGSEDMVATPVGTGRLSFMVYDPVDKRDDDPAGALRRAIDRAMKRLDRRIEAVLGDIARIQEAAAVAERAQAFVAHAARAPRGATKLEALDWSSGEPRPVEMPVDPARGAKEQIDAIFKRARRLKAGHRIAQERLDASRASRATLARLVQTLEAEGEGEPDLAALEAQARAGAPRDFRHGEYAAQANRSSASRSEARPPYRTFLGERGARILVGRGAAHNDALTFDIARPHDLWLHVKGRTGAHVIVPLDKTRPCPPDVLVEAAHLAAHFSDARDDPLVEVEYTPRRYVRKPRGSAPGLVAVGREKVMLLRRDYALLRKLLEREN